MYRKLQTSSPTLSGGELNVVPFQPAAYCRCLTASNNRIAALTETLRESSRPSMGMRMWASAASLHISVSPVDSVPITIAVGRLMSTL